MLRIEDINLIRLRMTSKGMTIKNLAQRIHTNPTKLNKLLNQQDSSEKLEKKLLEWLKR